MTDQPSASPVRRILGIDPGLGLTGYACLAIDAPGAEPTIVEAGVLRLQPKTPMATRLAQLHEDLSQLMDELKPDLVVVEQLFSHYKHVRTAILMGHARGVILQTAAARGLAIEELLPTEVKKAIAGFGHATKIQMQQAVMWQCGLDELPSPPDVADAIAIGLCVARRLASPQVV